jgi:indole-3-glycerol phosphate synthase
MNILETIIAHKRIEVEKRKNELSIADLMKGPFYKAETYSLKEALLDKTKTGIIAEYKRKSPSKESRRQKESLMIKRVWKK